MSETLVTSLPYKLREAYVSGDHFEECLKQAGWTLSSCRSLYLDPQVIRPPWLRTPTGQRYSDRALYHFFGDVSFRAVLHAIFSPFPITRDALSHACPDKEKLATFLTFFSGQDMLLSVKRHYMRGPTLSGIQDIGHTLEWWCAEWLRLIINPIGGMTAARHGVELTEMVYQGSPGDLDVLAFPGGLLMLVECKSSPKQAGAQAFARFCQRVTLLQPALALFLIDAPAPIFRNGHESMQSRFMRWQLSPLEGRGIFWDAGASFVAREKISSPQTGREKHPSMYAAVSGGQQTLEAVLGATLHHYQEQHGREPFNHLYSYL